MACATFCTGVNAASTSLLGACLNMVIFFIIEFTFAGLLFQVLLSVMGKNVRVEIATVQ